MIKSLPSSSQNFLIGAFKPPCHLSFTFADGRNRKQVPLKKENGQTTMVPLFQSQENIVGEVIIDPIQGKKVEHTGVKIELLGQIELYNDRGNFYDFTSLVRELEVPGDIYERKTYRFEFSTVEMPYESYNGVNVRLSVFDSFLMGLQRLCCNEKFQRLNVDVESVDKFADSRDEEGFLDSSQRSARAEVPTPIMWIVIASDGQNRGITAAISEIAQQGVAEERNNGYVRIKDSHPLYRDGELEFEGTVSWRKYVLKFTVSRNYVSSIVEYQDFVVHNYTPLPSINNSIKMEVGIEDCLHIEFEYNKSKYHLKDVIIGKIYFLLVRIKIKNMELEIRRRESTGSGANKYVETETLAKFELMDGAPVRGESIPVRLFLSPYEMTPTYRNTNNKFSVNYYLNLVLVDEEDRRYFKQQEITIYRLLETT
ncbi:hypothetical protein GIB67_000929 [Kingdonia uniflora]|uniref:Uncharacterized protein n=1 Tax=Kingdonia uniflora TaxID=39325 RepID=A0A7J7MFN6_9MAGN|nr:hypothetical protein GIB67_000929 [Kingdonia uniflora]